MLKKAIYFIFVFIFSITLFFTTNTTAEAASCSRDFNQLDDICWDIPGFGASCDTCTSANAPYCIEGTCRSSQNAGGGICGENDDCSPNTSTGICTNKKCGQKPSAPASQNPYPGQEDPGDHVPPGGIPPASQNPYPGQEDPGDHIPLPPPNAPGTGNTQQAASCIATDNDDNAFICTNSSPGCVGEYSGTTSNEGNFSCATAGMVCCKNPTIYARRGNPPPFLPERETSPSSGGSPTSGGGASGGSGGTSGGGTGSGGSIVITTPVPVIAKPDAVTINYAVAECTSSSIKQFTIDWKASPTAGSKYNVKVNDLNYAYDITGLQASGVLSEAKFLPGTTATVIVQACNAGGCTDATSQMPIGASCATQTSSCPDRPTTGGVNQCVSSTYCTTNNGTVSSEGNAACDRFYGTTGFVCCNTPQIASACESRICTNKGAADISCTSCGGFCNTDGKCGNPPGSTNTNTSPAPSTTISVAPATSNTSSLPSDGAAHLAPCNPNRAHLACLSSSDSCKPNLCGTGYSCLKTYEYVCPGTAGVVNSSFNCPACPTAPSQTAPSTAPAAPAGAGVGASCGSTSCQTGQGLSCSYAFYGGGSFCCPSGQRYCPNGATPGCTTAINCPNGSGTGNACSTATNHCYSGTNEECCGFPQKTCVKNGSNNATWYCK